MRWEAENRRCALAVGLGLVLVAWPASGEAVPDASSSGLWGHLRHGARLADDPGGWRSRLASYGLEFDAFFNHFVGWKLRGGASSGNALRQSGSYDAFARADLEALGLVPGLEVLFHLKGTFNRNINPYVDALSDPIDDADGDDGFWVPEAWAQQTFLEDRARLRVGYMDQQTVLDRNVYADSEDRNFMATFLDNNPVVPLKIGLGATLMLRPTSWFTLVMSTAGADNDTRKTGFDTALDGAGSLMGYFEAEFHLPLPGPRGPLPGHYRFGLVVDGSERPVFGQSTPTGIPISERGHLALYLSFDQLVFREGPEGLQGLGVFARWGHADDDVNVIEDFWSLGLEYRGLLPHREGDLLGVAMYQAIGSRAYRNEIDPDLDSETGLECYYRIQLTPWLTFTPDLQFIANPSGRRSARNAIALIWRTRVTF